MKENNGRVNLYFSYESSSERRIHRFIQESDRSCSQVFREEVFPYLNFLAADAVGTDDAELLKAGIDAAVFAHSCLLKVTLALEARGLDVPASLRPQLLSAPQKSTELPSPVAKPGIDIVDEPNIADELFN